MVRKLLRIVSILLVLALIFMGSMYYALFVAVNHTEVRYETLRSDKIPESMNDIQILFFTDVEYGAFMNENKLQDVIDTINDAQADVVIFGGDLFDHPEKNGIDEETASSLTEMLKQIDAPLGKYAVLGERDQVSEEVRTQVTQHPQRIDERHHAHRGGFPGKWLSRPQRRLQQHQRSGIQHHDHALSGSVRR